MPPKELRAKIPTDHNCGFLAGLSDYKQLQKITFKDVNLNAITFPKPCKYEKKESMQESDHENFLEVLLLMVSGAKSSAIRLINYLKGC